MKVEQFKRGFFDRPAVQAAIDKATQRLLSKFGAFVRTRARSSLRRRKRASAPGNPPSVHTRDPFASLKNVLFAYEAGRKSVVVGPVLLNGRRGLRRGQTVPELHEYGGTADRREVQLSGGRWVPASVTAMYENGKVRPSRLRAANYPARPFVQPAYKAELQGRLKDQLKNFVTR